MLQGFMLQGELAALSAALLWAIASVVYARLGDRIAPQVLNGLKGAIAMVYLGLTLLVLQRPFPLQFAPFHADPFQSLRAIALLVASGVLGIGLGDTYYFKALRDLGPRLSLLLEALAPPVSALLAWVSLGESLGIQQLLGIGLTVGGVSWVVSERHTGQRSVPVSAPSSSPPAFPPSSPWARGVGYGLLAAIAQAGGAVLSRAALISASPVPLDPSLGSTSPGPPLDPLWSTVLRLGAGVGFVGLEAGWRMLRRGRAPRLPTRHTVLNLSGGWCSLRTVAIAAFFSTYLGIWLQQISLKHVPAGIAQALGSTSPLFILPIVVGLGEKLSPRSVLGVAIALAGVVLLLTQA